MGKGCFSFFEREVSLVQDWLQHRALLGNGAVYAQSIVDAINRINRLNHVSEKELTATLKAFNLAFRKTKLTPLDDHESTSSGIYAFSGFFRSNRVDPVLNAQYGSGEGPGEYTPHNFVIGFNVVSELMEKNAKEYSLMYHRVPHASEMAADLHALYQRLPSDARTLKLFHSSSVLSGLFHDAVFTRNRGSDENHSCEKLIDFLNPALKKLSYKQQKIMKDILSVLLIDATMVALLNKDKDGNPFTTINSVFEIAIRYIDLDVNKINKTLEALIHAAQMMSDVDIRRAQISCLLESNVLKELGETTIISPRKTIIQRSWEKLNVFFDGESDLVVRGLKLRLSQSLRMLAESNYTKVLGSRMMQSFDGSPLERDDIDLLASKIKDTDEKQLFTEIKFGERMEHSKDSILPRYYQLIPDFDQKFIQLLERIHRYLMNATELEVQEVAVALIHVTPDQDGMRQSESDIRKMAQEIKEVILLMQVGIEKQRRYSSHVVVPVRDRRLSNG